MKVLFNRLKLLKGMLLGDVACTGSFYVCVDVTSRCNLHCLCCPYHSSLSNKPVSVNRDISFDMFENLCDDMKRMGSDEIVLQGEGEPLLHPRIFDIISAAKGKGLKVNMFTNGVLLNENRIKSLLDSGLDVLKVTLWATSPEQYEQNYPGSDKDNFRKVTEGLKFLAKFRKEKKQKIPFVELRYPINRNNFKTIDKAVEFSYTTGCNRIFFSITRVTDRQEKFKYFMLTPDEEKAVCYSLNHLTSRLKSFSVQHNINEILLRYRIGEAVWEKLPCYIGWIHARIKTDGRVFTCEGCNPVSMGNLNENRLDEIWNDSSFRNFRRKTMTRKGLASMSRECNCSFCCHIVNNYRIHQIFKWFSVFKKDKKNV